MTKAYIVVLATVAAFQFATLDMGICQDVVIDALATTTTILAGCKGLRPSWRQRCLVQDDKIRNKHYEYSRKILIVRIRQEERKKLHCLTECY